MQHLKFGLYKPLIHYAVKHFIIWLDDDPDTLEDFKVKMIKAIVQYNLDRELYDMLRGKDILSANDREILNNEERLLLVESALVKSPKNDGLLLELCKDVELDAERFVLFALANVSYETFNIVTSTCVKEPYNLRNALELASYEFDYNITEFVNLTKIPVEAAQLLVENSLVKSQLVDLGHPFFSDLVHSQILTRNFTRAPDLSGQLDCIIKTLYGNRPSPLTLIALMKIVYELGSDYGPLSVNWLTDALVKRSACQLFSSMPIEELSKVEKLVPYPNSILIRTGQQIYQARISKEA